jgi:uncharacterized membrane protein
LIALSKDFIVGVVMGGLLILAWRIVMEGGRQLVALSPVDPERFATSWLITALGAALLLALILILGRGCQALFGRLLATTPGFRRLARTGQLVNTEFSPTESQGFKVVLVKLTPEEVRQLAILSSVLEDAETGRKLATVFIPSTPNVRVGETRVLPYDQLTMTNWTVSDAITFLMSGGTVSPSKIHFDKGAPE